MSTSIERLLAGRADVRALLRARKRLVIAWCCAVFGPIGLVAGAAAMSWGWMVWPIWTFVAASWLWVAGESAAIQHAMRERWLVCWVYFLSALVPVANVVVAITMLLETSAVAEIGRRLRQKQCIRCGYDLQGLRDCFCPECGEEVPSNQFSG